MNNMLNIFNGRNKERKRKKIRKKIHVLKSMELHVS